MDAQITIKNRNLCFKVVYKRIHFTFLKEYILNLLDFNLVPIFMSYLKSKYKSTNYVGKLDDKKCVKWEHVLRF